MTILTDFDCPSLTLEVKLRNSFLEIAIYDIDEKNSSIYLNREAIKQLRDVLDEWLEKIPF